MKFRSRFLLFAGLVLLAASTLPAQRFISGGTNMTFGYGGGYGGYGYSGYGWGYSFGGFGFDDCLHHPEEHPPFGVGFAHGDPEFIQSTYMDYDQALALGKKILEEQSKPQASLGEIARQLRSRTRNYVPPPVPSSHRSPANGQQKFVVIQGDGGKLNLCKVADQACGNAT